jgi:hypothetical protein
MTVRTGLKSSMSSSRRVGMGFEERAKTRRRAGRGWIGGAALAVVFALYFYVIAWGLGLDEDPTDDVSPVVFWPVTLSCLIAAAVMLRRGIMLIRSARKQLKRDSKRRATRASDALGATRSGFFGLRGTRSGSGREPIRFPVEVRHLNRTGTPGT